TTMTGSRRPTSTRSAPQVASGQTSAGEAAGWSLVSSKTGDGSQQQLLVGGSCSSDWAGSSQQPQQLTETGTLGCTGRAGQQPAPTRQHQPAGKVCSKPPSSSSDRSKSVITLHYSSQGQRRPRSPTSQRYHRVSAAARPHNLPDTNHDRHASV